MAENNVFIDSDTLVQGTGLKDNEDPSTLINGATITMSLFEQTTLSPECSELSFTSGGTYTIEVGDVIQGVTSSAVAEVKAVVITSGSFAAGNAAGRLLLIKQLGTFQNEVLKLADETEMDIANILSDSSGAQTANAGSKTKIHIRNHGLTTNDYLRFQGTRNYDGECTIDAVEEDYVTINVSFDGTGEKFTGDEVIYKGISGGTNISCTHEGGDSDGYYDGVLPDTLLGLIENSYYYRFWNVTYGTVNLAVKQECKAKFFDGIVVT